MNERLKELEQKAASLTYEAVPRTKYKEYDHDTYKYDWEAAFRVQFAELIVREAARFLAVNSGYDDCNNAWFPETEDMLEHFGVEE
jgi:hypothetical protein